MTTSHLSLDAGRIAYDVRGEGPLVVCVPGMGDLRTVYRFLVPELVAAGYRVATMDLRGHGDSDASFSSYDDVATGRDILALVAHLAGPAVVIGNSLGAGAAVWAAAENGQAVERLVLVGPFVRQVPTNPLMTFVLRLLLLRPWGRRAWVSYYSKLYPGRPPEDLAAHRDAIARSLARPAHWKAFHATTHTSHAPVEARLGEVAAPTLVVMGTKDPDFKDPAAEARLIADRLGGEIVLVPGAGHYPQAEYPEVVAPAVLDFLSRTAPRA